MWNMCCCFFQILILKYILAYLALFPFFFFFFFAFYSFNAEFTLHDFSPCLADMFCEIADKCPKSNYQRGDLWESTSHRLCPWNIWHAKYLDLSAIQILLCELSLTEKNIGDELQPMREQDTGQDTAGSLGSSYMKRRHRQSCWRFFLL